MEHNIYIFVALDCDVEARTRLKRNFLNLRNPRHFLSTGLRFQHLHSSNTILNDDSFLSARVMQGILKQKRRDIRNCNNKHGEERPLKKLTQQNNHAPKRSEKRADTEETELNERGRQ